MKTPGFVFTLFLVSVLATATHAADDPLTIAKDQYASAAYEDALATLTKLADGGGLMPAVALQIDQYRSFCLVALGRTKDAEAVVQGIIRKEPLFELSADESSPRVEAMFTQVRRQLLPGLIRDRYREAKATVDRKELAAAEAEFNGVRKMIAKAEEFGLKDDAMADLAVLVNGFLDLARASSAAKPEPAPAPAPVVVAPPEPPAAPIATSTTPPPAARPGNETFNAGALDVTPPVAVRQRVPPVPPMLSTLARKRGTFDLTIEADGRVSDVAVRESVHVAYDTMIADAAKHWLYKPATRNGVPVRYVKSITLEVH